MGWNPEQGYYQKHVKEEGYANKITNAQEKFNKLKPEEIREGLNIVSSQLAKERGETVQEMTPSGDTIEYIVEEAVNETEELDR